MNNIIKGNLKRILCPIFYYTGYYNHKLSRQKEKAIILMYHRIHEKGDGDGVNKGTFERQMEFIKRKMTPIPLTDISDWLSKKKPLPPRAIAITFDDGYEDNFKNGYPILRKFDIPATIFLTSGHIETKKVFWWDKVNEMVRMSNVPFINVRDFQSCARNGYMYPSRSIMLNTEHKKIHAIKAISELFKTFEFNRISEAVTLLQKLLEVEDREIEGPPMLNWHQIREMSNNGIDFGAHTVTHPNLAAIDLNEARMEIETSKRMIEEKINRPVRGFAYPYGLNKHINGTLKNIVRELNFHFACSAETGVVSNDHDGYSLRRISVSINSTPLMAYKMCKNMIC